MEISFSKFREYVTPILKQAGRGYPAQRKLELNFELQEIQKMAWLESLLDLLNAHLTMHADHDSLRTKYMLDADVIFDEIDVHKSGWISHISFKKFVNSECSFSISDHDLLILQPILDDSRDGQITRDEFIAAFGAFDEGEDLDHAGAEKYHNEVLEKKLTM